MRIVLCSTLALLLGMGTAVAFPTEEVPKSEAEYMAKVRTAAPEQIVSKATIIAGRKTEVSPNWGQWLHLFNR
jgi:hypothetical protein